MLWRDLYTHALYSEVFFDEKNLRSLMADEASDIHVLPENLAATVGNATSQWRGLIEDAVIAGSVDSLATHVLTQSAPLGLSLGCWLQGLTAPAIFEDAGALRALALFADDVGAGAAGRARADAFRAVARQHGISFPAGAPIDLAGRADLDDRVFRWPALLQALSRRSDVFALELLGIDLVLREIGSFPAWAALAKACPGPDWNGLNLAVAQTRVLTATPLSTIRALVAVLSQDGAAAARIASGQAWASTMFNDWDNLLFGAAEEQLDPRSAMITLLQRRTREAKHYHQSVVLEGRSLSQWFEEARTDPVPLVDALARSRLVRPDAPARSALFSSSISPGGSMFRIFDTDELTVIERWIASLARSATPNRTALVPRSPPLHTSNVIAGDMEIGSTPKSLRDAYYILQGRCLPPRTREFAIDYCTFWFERAVNSIDQDRRSMPRRWQAGELRRWLLAYHEEQCQLFRERGVDCPDRKTLIDQTVQLAPLTLIDGAWLQGWTDVSVASTPVGAPLFRTYWDELGNGDPAINHPKLFRQLLSAMGVDLPPTGSRDFANTPRIRTESFRLAVLWLALGKLPITFRPEILGLNLAMELSGVGGSYRSAHTHLSKYGYPTIFVDLHNTIDNVSSGHSGWAADAIDAHMAAIGYGGDRERHWYRVRTGYEALSPLVKNSRQLDYFRKEGGLSDYCGTDFRHGPLAASLEVL